MELSIGFPLCLKVSMSLRGVLLDIYSLLLSLSFFFLDVTLNISHDFIHGRSRIWCERLVETLNSQTILECSHEHLLFLVNYFNGFLSKIGEVFYQHFIVSLADIEHSSGKHLPMLTCQELVDQFLGEILVTSY